MVLIGCSSIFLFRYYCYYCNTCPQILYTKVSDKMAYVNSADPDHTACKCLKKPLYKKQNLYLKKMQ